MEQVRILPVPYFACKYINWGVKYLTLNARNIQQMKKPGIPFVVIGILLVPGSVLMDGIGY
jgi:hypothetical protein